MPEDTQRNARKQPKYSYANYHGSEIQNQENKYAKVKVNYDNNTIAVELKGHLEREKRQAGNCFRRRCRQVGRNKRILPIILRGQKSYFRVHFLVL